MILDIRNNSGGSDAYWLRNIANLLGAPASFEAIIAIRRNLVADGRINFPVFEITPEDGQNLPPDLLDGDFVGWKLRYFLRMDGHVGYKGKLYVLTSRTNYSSAESFVVACKATGLATLVGTYTGGDGIGITPGLIILPNSGLAVRFPVDMGLNPDGSANEEFHTRPDVLVEQTPEDFLRWLDTVTNEGFPRGPRPDLDPVLRECLDLATDE